MQNNLLYSEYRSPLHILLSDGHKTGNCLGVMTQPAPQQPQQPGGQFAPVAMQMPQQPPAQPSAAFASHAPGQVHEAGGGHLKQAGQALAAAGQQLDGARQKIGDAGGHIIDAGLEGRRFTDFTPSTCLSTSLNWELCYTQLHH
jgi:hypothetical protein